MKTQLLNPVHPNIGLEIAYRRRLERLIEEMHKSITYWLSAAYKRNKPELIKLFAEDASPANTLHIVMRRLARRWQRTVDGMAEELAKHFAQSVSARSDAALKNLLQKAGWSIKFKTSRAVNDSLQAIVHENVVLIRSIPQQYLNQVEQAVMRSVQAGRDLENLTRELKDTYRITQNRAELIARDQNNKATAAITKVRQLEVGLNEAIWVHSGGGRHPRPTHVKAGRDRVRYKVAEGWLDPAINKKIWPGTEVNCRCVSRPVLPI